MNIAFVEYLGEYHIYRRSGHVSLYAKYIEKGELDRTAFRCLVNGPELTVDLTDFPSLREELSRSLTAQGHADVQPVLEACFADSTYKPYGGLIGTITLFEDDPEYTVDELPTGILCASLDYEVALTFEEFSVIQEHNRTIT